jgi:dimethylglycine dehydrogenase
MVKPELAEPGTEVDVFILGKPHKAVVVAESPYDGANAALRG